jgi:hypothetical protein
MKPNFLNRFMKKQECVGQRSICGVSVRLALVHVKTSRRDLSGPQRVDERFIIDQDAACCIYDNRSLR